jgi:choline dehydrogenase-like flavoprotein
MALQRAVDAVCIGFGWTAGIIANELTKAGHTVVGLERGEFRNTDPDFEIPSVHDELSYAIRYKLFQDASRETYTFRNERSQTALPIRQFGSFLGTARRTASRRGIFRRVVNRSRATVRRFWAIAPRKTGASPTASSSPTTTGSRKRPESRAKPEICAARRFRAATRSKALGKTNTLSLR